jgi:hypothetical protein
MSADLVTVALSVGGAVVAACATLVSTAWVLRGQLATKHDIQEIRDDQEKHETKDDDRWEAQGQRSEDLAWTLGEIAGAMGIQPRRPDPRASRPR